ncbi:tetratricopeptide repeat protein [Candidatus Bathyarchaeota archaeon]|nr:tetratricopeptide repeat protein [Candidatus Bathyarchaeota archaeon]
MRCVKCGYEAPMGATFCPSCGAPLAVKMSDEEISKLVLRMFGKKEDEALEAARVACLSDISTGVLHSNLLLRFPVPDLMPKEQEYQDDALRRFMDKFRDDPRLGEALGHYKLGLICENRRRVKEAAKEYEIATALFPGCSSAHLRRGMLHEIQRKTKNALECYLRAGGADPQFTLAFFDQGLMYRHLKKWDNALESYRRVVALDPDNAAAHNNMGLIYTDKRDWDNAIREFEEILRILPNHPTGLKNLRIAKIKSGRR